jgi:hypothetical protein
MREIPSIETSVAITAGIQRNIREDLNTNTLTFAAMGALVVEVSNT